MENKQAPALEQAPEIKEGFFLRRPIFSTVISLIITLVGAIAISVLPVEQYPDLTPPQVEVNATYTGASANVIAETVASLLESQINGVDNMIYMNSVSSGTGSMSLTVSFNVGTDPDQATIDVNNRVQLALAQLPQEVQRMGVSVLKKSSSMLQIIFLTSPDQRYNTIYLSNYALLNIVDELKRLPGVGDAKNFAAQDYSMRVWLKPDVMSQLGVTPEDIATALRDQNAQFAAGRMGAEPMSPGVGVTWQITTQGRLTTPEQFGDVILRTQPDGSILRLKDVATIELGAQSYDFVGKYNGLDAVPIGIYLSPGANALATAEVVKAKMEELSKEFPVGVAYIDGEGLHQVGVPLVHRVDPPGVVPVLPVVGGEEHQLRALAPGLPDGLGGLHLVPLGGLVLGQDDPVAGIWIAAHRHRSVPELRVVQQFHRGVKAVQITVQNHPVHTVRLLAAPL